MDLHRKSELELKYFLERRLVSVASGSAGPGSHPQLDKRSEGQDHFEEINLRPPIKNKYQQQSPITRNNNFLQSRLKKSSSCNELVLQFEEHLRQQQGQFKRPSMAVAGGGGGGFMPRRAIEAAAVASPILQRKRPMIANHDLFEAQLDGSGGEKTNNHRPVQRIVSDLSGQNNSRNEKLDSSKNGKSNEQQNHKVVIYFGDSIGNNRKTSGSVGDLINCSRTVDQQEGPTSVAQLKKKAPPVVRPENNKNDVMKQLKSVLEEKKINTQKESKVILVNSQNPPPPPPPMNNLALKSKPERVIASKPSAPPPPMAKPPRKDKTTVNQPLLKNVNVKNDVAKNLLKEPEFDFVESVTNGVINIKIDGSYNAAKELVDSVTATRGQQLTIDGQVVEMCHSDESFDWAFVQEWRARYELAITRTRIVVVVDSS